MRGLATALRLLSVLPIPGRDADQMSSALPWFPLAGAALGGILYGMALLLDGWSGGGWPEGVAAAVLLGSVMLTGAFHLDGLADWADGFGGGHTSQEALAIMKDSRIGAFGVIALVLVLLIKWVSLARLVESDAFIWIVAAYIVSRTMQAELAAWLPYARPEGGTAASIVQGARPFHRICALISALIMVLILGGPAGVLALGAGWVACRGFGWWCRRRLGGVTGDLLGAGSEIVETLILVIYALAWR
ncbi:MAG: adenosylcobinamide-GDP ribazoletransferase [bacterium]